ncbi:GNAT family N-acetyltransferase [Cesiribacter andamanensis]|uniref:Putative N-acetyltransferase YsnE n=1 Tax=Cesiribacter andamanensis AMV16 TaxID=1279009 RepID=M7NVG0_9BACT|nr:GNAT family N-acetyltransferase [Cesiribacter andamanensis]EMR02459.1 putative N-acetyltransferase YsnE [Cesiribacter andamanensis AMV16]
MLHYLRTTSSHSDFVALVRLLDADLKLRDGDDHAFYNQFNSIANIRHALLAYQGDTPVGCGALKAYDEQTLELKRMYVRPEYRRQGIARGLLSELERWAQELGYRQLILETGQAQPEAIALYRHSGWQLIPNYGQYAGVTNSVCMQKLLQP